MEKSDEGLYLKTMLPPSLDVHVFSPLHEMRSGRTFCSCDALITEMGTSEVGATTALFL